MALLYSNLLYIYKYWVFAVIAIKVDRICQCNIDMWCPDTCHYAYSCLLATVNCILVTVKASKGASCFDLLTHKMVSLKKFHSLLICLDTYTNEHGNTSWQHFSNTPAAYQSRQQRRHHIITLLIIGYHRLTFFFVKKHDSTNVSIDKQLDSVDQTLLLSLSYSYAAGSICQPTKKVKKENSGSINPMTHPHIQTVSI